MERVITPYKMGVMRRLLKQCFRSVAPALVPTEVWWDIVLGTDVRAMTLLAQTSKGFWQLVEEIRRRNLWIALEYRRINQIPMAKRCLTLCANHGIPEAMFHIGYARQHGGFGFKKSYRCNDWIKKASDAGYPLAMAIMAYAQNRSRKTLIDKVFLSKDECAMGYCCWLRHSSFDGSKEECISYFTLSAVEGNEFGQCFLASCYEDGLYQEGHEIMSSNYGLAVYWHTKAAEQGHAKSQKFMYKHYRKHSESINEAGFWKEKLKTQCHNY